MSSFLYLPRDSFIHRLHPATKIIGLVLLFMPPLAFNHPAYVACCIAAGVMLLIWSDCLANLGRIWRFVAAILIFATLMWTLFVELPYGFPFTGAFVRHEIGQAWLAALRDPVVYIPLLLAAAGLLAGRRAAPGAPELPPLVMGAAFGWTLYCVHVYGFEAMDSSVYLLGPDAAVLGGIPSAEAVRPYSMYALAMGLRISSFLIAGLVFISTTRVEAFAAGLRSLGLPVSACFALSLGFRLVPTYAATAVTVVQAQRSRGQDFERGGLVGRLRRYVPLIIPVIAYALRRADGLAMALESKGFGGGSKRTEFLPLRFGLRDAITLLVLVALAAGTIYARCAGHGVVLPRL